MITITNNTKIFMWLHDNFRKWYPIIARKLKLKRWEGDAWHRLTTYRWKKKIILITSDNLRMKVRCNHLVDLTAVFGRPEESQIGIFIQNLPRGGTFVDAGAHIGRYTLKAAKSMGPLGRVLAFEPDPKNCELLCDNCKLNGYDWVKIEQCALGAENGRATLISGNDAATNTILPEWYNNLQPKDDIKSAKRIDVPIRRLDDILEDKDVSDVDLLKVDVEGAEMQLFKGVSGCLDKHLIRSIICEVHSPVVTMSEVVKFLKQYGYETKKLGGSEIYAQLA
jgi:FkbM family methyltransferase